MEIIEDAEKIQNYKKKIKDECIKKHGEEYGINIMNGYFNVISKLIRYLQAEFCCKNVGGEQNFKYRLVLKFYDTLRYDDLEYIILLSKRAGYTELSHSLEEALDLIPLYIEFKNHLRKDRLDGFLKSISLEQLGDIRYLSRLEYDKWQKNIAKKKNGKIKCSRNYKKEGKKIWHGLSVVSEYYNKRLEDIINHANPVSLNRKYPNGAVKKLMLSSFEKNVS